MLTITLVASANGTPVLFRPPDCDDISFTIAVANSANASHHPAIFLQIEAPIAVEWIALGLGDQMDGADMFLVYASSPKGVTVSPRAGTGHVPPEYNPKARFSILPKTGIVNETMIARFQCHSCLEVTTNATESASSWIWAYKNGPPMNTHNVTATIDFHDAFGAVVVDLNHARSTDLSDDGDPFRDARLISEPSTSESPAHFIMAIAHGCLMGITFVLLHPLFALLVRLSSYRHAITKVHAPLQGLALLITIAGFILGVKMWVNGGTTPAAHPIIGVIVVASLLLLQPSLGWLQHIHFRRTGNKSMFAYGHRWLGRTMIVLGMINGGLGFWWVGSGTRSWRAGLIVYAVVAGVVFLVYMLVHICLLAGVTRQQEDVHGIRPEDEVSIEQVGSLAGGDGGKALGRQSIT
ncbi:cytochrome and DOMON domain-containing protein [Aspergillus fischeri NRRL 181]|uniref:Cellobiose dehydrogenase n=1 Tax=Neosartorya fischeri (strain ATCC 1020 / DSM 3700 / CBS 544.65 / FGSC A1164 / JCM 1740 / NRRL 181 / WB 181) TaxID=331117 RepID=A1CVG5_NEOFI|nr:conserved hypothetical protein [Aspergillus fischeri NRRL 181]EAW25742.1 conserved hypothetical protein [Aspergillus fischeri NRRL 181]